MSVWGSTMKWLTPPARSPSLSAFRRNPPLENPLNPAPEPGGSATAAFG